MNEVKDVRELTGDQQHPWPGLDSYQEAGRQHFHGREQEVVELLGLIRRESLTVLYGRSGLGKTSLLQAGIFRPLRDEHFFPVRIHLSIADGAPDLREQVLAAVRGECAQRQIDCTAAEVADPSLWAWFHQAGLVFWSEDDCLVTPVLIFDQFEEIFTLGRQDPGRRARCEAFLGELGDLVENRIPVALRRQVATSPAVLKAYDARAAGPRTVISFREEFLPDFEGLTDYFRSRTSNRLRLLPMNGKTAVEAIVRTGAGILDERSAEEIVRFIDKTPLALDELKIEPVFLSLICKQLNEKRLAEDKAQIDPAWLQSGGANEILSDFYRKAFVGISPDVQRFVEESLLTKKGGHRDTCELENALAEPGVSEADIDTLVDRRLLRREERAGRVRLELIHDVLVEVAKKSRDQRRDAELRRKERRRLQWLGSTLSLCLLILFGVSWSAYKAMEANRVAERNIGLAFGEKAKALYGTSLQGTDGQVYASLALARMDPAQDSVEMASLLGLRALRHRKLEHITSYGLEQALNSANRRISWSEKDETFFLSDGNVEAGVQLFEGQTLQPLGRKFAAPGASHVWWLSRQQAFAQFAGGEIRRYENEGSQWLPCVEAAIGQNYSFQPTTDGRLIFLQPNPSVASPDPHVTAPRPVLILDAGNCQVRHTIAVEDTEYPPVISPDGSYYLFTKVSRVEKSAVSGSAIKYRTLHLKHLRDAGLSADLPSETMMLWAFEGGLSSNLLFARNGAQFVWLGSAKPFVWEVSARKATSLPYLTGKPVAMSTSGEMLVFREHNNSSFQTGDRQFCSYRAYRTSDFSAVGYPIATHCNNSSNGTTFHFLLGNDRLFAEPNGIWDLRTGRQLHLGEPLAVSNDGQRLAVIERAPGGGDLLRFWRLGSEAALPEKGAGLSGDDRAQVPRRVVLPFMDWTALQADAKSKNIALPTRRSVNTYAGDIGKVPPQMQWPQWQTHSPDQSIAVSAWANLVLLSSLIDAKVIAGLLGQASMMDAVEFTSDRRFVAIGFADGMVRVIDLQRGNVLSAFKGADVGIARIWASPDSKHLAVAGYQGGLRIFALNGGEEVARLDYPGDTVWSFAFSPDGKKVAAGTDRGLIHVLEAGQYREIRTMPTKKGRVWGLAFSPDVRWLSAGLQDSLVQLFDVDKGSLRVLLDPKINFWSHPSLFLSFSHDGKWLFIESSKPGSNQYTAYPIYLSDEIRGEINFAEQAASEMAIYGYRLDGITLMPLISGETR